VTSNQIEVVGSATRDVEPDEATWLAEVVVADADHRTAFDRCAERAAALFERLAPLGDATTGPIAVQPRLTHRHERSARNEAKASVSVRCPIATASDVARVAMEAGADRLRGPALTATSADAAQEDLLAEAVAAARRKAQRAADAAGRSLGQVLSVAEDHGRGEWVYAASASAESGDEPVHTLPIRPDAIRLSARVTVVVALID
jgi:uncharacterized protein YggE